MTASDANPYPQIKAYERREFDRLSSYLEGLSADGWVEQSYCTDWLVYQVVSHIGSGARIGGLRVDAWVNNGPAVNRDVMQGVWGFFDGLAPDQMLAAFKDARDAYLATEEATADEAGLQEVDGFAGKRPMWAYQLSRAWELSLHAWDVYVTRDASASLDRDAVALLASNLQHMNLPLDRDRAAALTSKPIGLRLTDSGAVYTLDPSAERPRVQAGSSAAAPLVVEGPDEEIIRLVAGRDFVPGRIPHLRVATGSAQDLNTFRRAFR